MFNLVYIGHAKQNLNIFSENVIVCRFGCSPVGFWAYPKDDGLAGIARQNCKKEK